LNLIPKRFLYWDKKENAEDPFKFEKLATKRNEVFQESAAEPFFKTV
jgi:hypothetical protein